MELHANSLIILLIVTKTPHHTYLTLSGQALLHLRVSERTFIFGGYMCTRSVISITPKKVSY